MQILCYIKSDDSVAIGHVSPTVLMAMTGQGGLIRPENLDREVAKHLMETSDDELEFKEGWEEFLVARLGTPREIILRAFMEGVTTGGLTEMEALQRIADKDKPTECVNCHIMDESELPVEQEERGNMPPTDFRGAWEHTENAIIVNMPKARGIHMDRIRINRNAELVKKDIEFMRAVELEDGSHKAIAAEKQTLRDIPQTFDLTTEHDSPEELKQKWPEGLPKDN